MGKRKGRIRKRKKTGTVHGETERKDTEKEENSDGTWEQGKEGYWNKGKAKWNREYRKGRNGTKRTYIMSIRD